MYEIQVEIDDGTWQSLELFDYKVRYNYGLGDIGDINTRTINHSNTYPIRNTGRNIDVLDINVYNSITLADSLNTKYNFRITRNTIVERSGSLIISSIKEDIIHINLMDDSLNLLDSWGEIKLRELMISSVDAAKVPSSYKAALYEMEDFVMPTASTEIDTLSDISGESYPLASFPNTLNNIGEDFNKNTDGSRYANALNVFQTRPVFNQKAILDLACYGLGYTPEYGGKTNVSSIEKMYIVGEGNSGESNPLESNTLNSSSNIPSYYESSTGKTREWMAQFSSPGTTPNSYSGWDPLPGNTGYEDRPCVYPFNNTNNLGTITMSAIFSNPSGVVPIDDIISVVEVYGVWYDAAGTSTINKHLLSIPTYYLTLDSNGAFSLSFNKNQLSSEPVGAGVIIGFMIRISATNPDWTSVGDLQLANQVVIETSAEPINISYDENKQYTQGAVDLRYEAPDVSVKEIVSDILKQHGLFIDIQYTTRKVSIFSYADIIDKKNDKNWQDWSDYFIKVVERDTNFGTNFGQVNNISLKDPFQGNIFERKLAASVDSKYTPVATIQTSILKDVSEANSTPLNDSTTPINYLEFTHKGLGAVEYNGEVEGLTQSKVDNATGASLTSVHYLANVNYALLPDGIDTWLDIIQSAVRETIMFLLPIDIIRELELDTPVFVKQTASVYFINKIKEYQDNTEAVIVQLIKI